MWRGVWRCEIEMRGFLDQMEENDDMSPVRFFRNPQKHSIIRVLA